MRYGLNFEHGSRKVAIRCQRSTKSKPGIGRPIAFFSGVEAWGDRSHKVPQSDDASQENPGLHQMPKRKQNASSSFGRSESHNPTVQASGEQLQSKEDDDMTNLLRPGVKLLRNSGTRIEEHLGVFSSQRDCARPDIGGPVAFQSPSVLRKDTSKTSEIPLLTDVEK